MMLLGNIQLQGCNINSALSLSTVPDYFPVAAQYSVNITQHGRCIIIWWGMIISCFPEECNWPTPSTASGLRMLAPNWPYPFIIRVYDAFASRFPSPWIIDHINYFFKLSTLSSRFIGTLEDLEWFWISPVGLHKVLNVKVRIVVAW